MGIISDNFIVLNFWARSGVEAVGRNDGEEPRRGDESGVGAGLSPKGESRETLRRGVNPFI